MMVRNIFLLVIVAVPAIGSDPTVEFDVSKGAETPLMAAPPWTLRGQPMDGSDGKLIQHSTSSTDVGVNSYYLSPALSGLIADRNRDYGIEFRVKPLSDIPSLGNSHFANLVVGWSDSENSYNLTINRSTSDIAEGASLGDLNGAGNQMQRVAEEIDWSVPRVVFIGYKSADQMFELFVDKRSVGVFPREVISSDPVEEFIDRVAFGDTTSGQGNDVGAEWYFVRVYDSAEPSP